MIDDAEKQGRVITKELRHKIYALSIQLKRNARKGIRHTRKDIDAKLDPLKTGPVSTAVIDYFENMEVNIDDATLEEIKTIVNLLKRDARHTLHKTHRKIKHELEKHRPVVALII